VSRPYSYPSAAGSHWHRENSLNDDSLDQRIGASPSALAFPQTDGNGNSQESIHYDHRVELFVS
jgi:hypothetical protein